MIFVDISEVKEILSHKGVILGLSGKTHIDTLAKEILQTCQESLKNAKGIILLFEMSDDGEISKISKQLNAISDFIEDSEHILIFDVDSNNDLHKDEIIFKLLYTLGENVSYRENIEELQNKNIETTLYQKLHKENQALKEKITSLEKYSKRLETSMMIQTAQKES